MQVAQDIVSCCGGQMCSPFYTFIHNMYVLLGITTSKLTHQMNLEMLYMYVIRLLGITTSKLTHQMNLEMLYMYIGNVLKYSGIK